MLKNNVIYLVMHSSLAETPSFDCKPHDNIVIQSFLSPFMETNRPEMCQQSVGWKYIIKTHVLGPNIMVLRNFFTTHFALQNIYFAPKVEYLPLNSFILFALFPFLAVYF